MKNFFSLTILILFLASLNFISCSKEDDVYPEVSFGIIIQGGLEEECYIKLDDRGIAFPIGGIPKNTPGSYDWKIGDRIIVSYYINEIVSGESNYRLKIEVSSIGLVPTQSSLLVESSELGEDAMFEDINNPIQMFVTDDYLTIRPLFFATTMENLSKHTFKLAYIEQDHNTDTTVLSLAHDAKEDAGISVGAKWLAFKLNEVKQLNSESDSVVLAIKYPVITTLGSTNYELKTQYLTYKWGGTYKSDASISTKPFVKDVETLSIKQVR